MIEEMGWVFRGKVIGGWIRKGIVSLLRAFWEGNLWGEGGVIEDFVIIGGWVGRGVIGESGYFSGRRMIFLSGCFFSN